MLVTINRNININGRQFIAGQQTEINDEMFNRCGSEYFTPAEVKREPVVQVEKKMENYETKPVRKYNKKG